jgi:hypothetical protein
MRAWAFALVSSVGFGPLGCRSTPDSEPPSPAASAPLPASSASFDTATPGYVAGHRYTYRLKMTSKLKFESRGDLYDFDLMGELELASLRVGPSGTELRAKLRNARVQSRVGGQAEFERILGQFEQPFAITLAGGLVRETFLPKELNPLVAGAFRSIGAALQVARPATAASTWSADEYDTTGSYSAEYRLAAGDPTRIEKRKSKYSSVLLAKGQPKPAVELTPKVSASRGEIRTGGDGRPLSITLDDELSLQGAQTPIASRVSISLTAEGQAERADAEPSLELLRAQNERFAADEPYASRVPEAVIDQAKINGMSFATITDRMEELAREARSKKPPKDGEGRPVAAEQTQEDSRLFVALGATFRQRPDTIATALEKIRADSPAKFAFVDALGAAESAEARDALIALSQPATKDLKLRTTALVALSRSERPTPEGAAALKALIDDQEIGTQALYGVGSYSRRFRDKGDVVQADALGQVLLSRLASAPNEYRVVEALRAISNSGFAGAFDKARGLLEDRRERVRAAAVRALRSMLLPEVDPLLVARLVDDSARDVRLAALETMQSRSPNDTLVAGLKNSSSTSDPHVRYRIVELMVRWRSQHPDLRASLEAVAANEQEPKIRDLAKAALL